MMDSPRRSPPRRDVGRSPPPSASRIVRDLAAADVSSSSVARGNRATPGLIATPRQHVDASFASSTASAAGAVAKTPGGGDARRRLAGPSASAAGRVPGETRRELELRLDEAAQERHEEEAADAARLKRRQRAVDILSTDGVGADVRDHFLMLLDEAWVLELIEMYHDPVLPRNHWREWLQVAMREGERYPYVIRRMQARRFTGGKELLKLA